MYELINLPRILNDLNILRQFGLTPQGGVSRHPFTAEDEKARAYLLSQASLYNLQSHVDPMSNVIIRYQGHSTENKAMLLGSHYDTVINGGSYDGILGVVIGLEILRIMSEQNIPLPYPLQLIAFNDEEGSRFGKGFSGSKGVTGLLKEEDVYKSIDNQGISLAQAMESAGFDPTLYTQARINPQDMLAYLELHIEQGPVLESENKDIGIVTGIVGSCRYRIKITGRADHAGTTPMNMRLDPLLPASRLWAQLPALAKALDELAVATVGFIIAEPGASNVVANSITFTLDVRSLKPLAALKTSQHIIAALKELCHEGYTLNVESLKATQHEEPTPMCQEVMTCIEEAAQDLDISYSHLGSGAGHDAELFAPLCPTGMIFVPSQQGRSHSPLEYTKPEHILKGAQVMMLTVIKLMKYFSS